MDAEKAAKALSSYRKNVETQTGKTIDQIFAMLKKSGAASHGDMINYLKTDLGLGHGHAMFVVSAYKNPAFNTASEKAVAADKRPAKKAPAKKPAAKK